MHIHLALLLLAQVGPYSVSGRVFLDDDRPFAGAEISATTNGWDAVNDPALSDAQGRFTITGLPAGAYILSASRDDLGSFFYGQSPQPGIVTSVNLSALLPHQDIAFRVSRPVTIAGVVHTSTGAPMSNAHVWAVRRAWSNGKPSLQITDSSITDDLGRFRIARLSRGRYLVCATLPQAQPVLPVGFARFGDKPNAVFTEACYPESSKALLKLNSGQKLDVDIVFRPAYPAVVSGRILNAEGVESISVQLSLDPASVGRNTLYTQADPSDHSFHIPNVLPGRYRLIAQAHSNGQPDRDLPSATVILDLADSDRAVDLTLTEPLHITAAIHAPPHDDKITVGLRPADDPGAPTYEAESQPDGGLLIPLPYAGRYWLITRGTLCPSDARLEQPGVEQKADAKDYAVQINPGLRANLDVTFTSDCGKIQGTVVDSSGKPVPNARHLILLTGTPDDPGDLLLASADDHGAFSYYGLIPGKYLMWAWSDADEWDGLLASLHDLAPQQTVIEVLPKQTATVKLRLLRSPQ
jgi:hypothetical protein